MKNIFFLSILSISLFISCTPKSSKEEALSYYKSINDPFKTLKTESKQLNKEALGLTKKYINTEAGQAPMEEVKIIQEQLNTYVTNLIRTEKAISAVKEIQSVNNLKKETLEYLIEIKQLYNTHMRFVLKMLADGVDNFKQEDLKSTFTQIGKIEDLSKKYDSSVKSFYEEFSFSEAEQ
jgi:hypothetical protein